MSGTPLSTKVLIVLLVIASLRFFYIWSGRSQSPVNKVHPSSQKINTSQVEQILSCKQYTEQIKSCTSQAMVCLQEIAKSKKFHQQNEQKILACQTENQKNIKLNKQLRIKLDAVTERLDDLINRKKKTTQTNGNTEL